MNRPAGFLGHKLASRLSLNAQHFDGEWDVVTKDSLQPILRRPGIRRSLFRRWRRDDYQHDSDMRWLGNISLKLPGTGPFTMAFSAQATANAMFSGLLVFDSHGDLVTNAIYTLREARKPAPAVFVLC